MDTREDRGMQIAEVSQIVRDGTEWVVPSQSGHGAYRVNLEAQTCNCPDHEVRHTHCKHIIAAEIVFKRETAPDGTVVETRAARITYAQDWPAYNAAQTEERDRVTALLGELCASIPQPIQTAGRPRLPLSDMLFAAVMKVYTGFSSRRFASDMREACRSGRIAKAPHFNSVSNYMADPDITPLLRELVTTSSLPMRVIETDFAVDSSGFGTSRFVRWFNKKYGREIDNREWVKVHLMCGVQTHIVTSVEVSGWTAHDTAYFAPLLATTAEHFRIGDVSADKAYLSRRNLALVEQAGGVPFVPFKSNTVVPQGDSAWTRMYHYFAYNRETFLEHYHQRSNVETVFSMIKAKFGDSVRSKSDTGMVNESLAKVLCHNLCVVNQAIHEFGIDPTFCAGSAVAQKQAV